MSRPASRTMLPRTMLLATLLALAVAPISGWGIGNVVRFPAMALKGLGHVATTPVRMLRNRGKDKGDAAVCVASAEPSDIKTSDIKTTLEAAGQGHLFAGLTAGQTETLLKQAAVLDTQLPGGIQTYVETARTLLKDSAEGKNPFEGFSPEVPQGEKLVIGDADFLALETLGKEAISEAGFVLVAGGLGERLGYSGIKIELPLYIAEREASFLSLYVQHILQLQGAGKQIPLAIMTSGDTHAQTVALLAKHNNFGMAPGQITIMQQNLVPALKDSDARFAANADGTIATKPHGHGDVHTLLHQTGTAEAWQAQGVKWVVFFQDTNGIIFRALPSVLGVSKRNDMDVNSVCVPRTPGEAVGGLCKLTHKDGRQVTVNVEYNQLDPLLRSTEQYAGGDVADASGHSPFPGNINILVFKMSSFSDVLKSTEGRMKEFVNPKYKDDTKTTFKSPTRLECMMQDYPLLLPASAKVGFTQLDRWLCFSPVKNNLVDAALKAEKKMPAECAGSAESDAMALNARLLKMAGVSIEDTTSEPVSFSGVPLAFGPMITLLPSFGTCLTDVKARIADPSKVSISAGSALTIEGDVTVRGSLNVNGALVIRATKGAKIIIDNLAVNNAGWKMVPAEGGDVNVAMRGYNIEKSDTREIVFEGPGEHVIDEA